MIARQLEVLQHSIGVDQYGQGPMNRNHFCAGGEDVDLCRSLVALGFMVERTASELTGGNPLFHVTESGKQAVRAESPRPPKLTRSQQRYRAFLREDCGHSFGEWLSWQKARREEACR